MSGSPSSVSVNEPLSVTVPPSTTAVTPVIWTTGLVAGALRVPGLPVRSFDAPQFVTSFPYESGSLRISDGPVWFGVVGHGVVLSYESVSVVTYANVPSAAGTPGRWSFKPSPLLSRLP